MSCQFGLRLASYFLAEFYIFGSTFLPLSLSLSLSLDLSQSLFIRSMPGLGSLDSCFAVGVGPWVIVAMVGPWSHPSSFGLPCALDDVRAVSGSWVRGPPIFL